MLEGKKTPEKIRAILANLKPNPLRGKYAIKPEAIARYCAKAGRHPQSAEALCTILRRMEKTS
jgi:hypothetical protein